VARPVDLYLCMSGEGSRAAGFRLAERLRDTLPQLRVMSHCGGGNFKKQVGRADKLGADIALILGEAEIANEQVGVKFLREQGEQQLLQWDELIQLLVSRGA
jgi:histidyl-tRNA synthetase